MWGLIDCAAFSGVSRAGMYLMQPFFRCDPFLSDAPIAFCAFVGSLIAVICLKANGRLRPFRKFRINTALLFWHLLAGTAMTLTTILFECPADRVVDPVIR